MNIARQITVTVAYQSGFRANHSAVSALVQVINDLKISRDSEESSVLVMLDLSAVDRDILHQRLRSLPGRLRRSFP